MSVPGWARLISGLRPFPRDTEPASSLVSVRSPEAQSLPHPWSPSVPSRHTARLIPGLCQFPEASRQLIYRGTESASSFHHSRYFKPPHFCLTPEAPSRLIPASSPETPSCLIPASSPEAPSRFIPPSSPWPGHQAALSLPHSPLHKAASFLPHSSLISRGSKPPHICLIPRGTKRLIRSASIASHAGNPLTNKVGLKTRKTKQPQSKANTRVW